MNLTTYFLLGYDPVSIVDYISLNDRMRDEWCIGTDLEGNSHGLSEILSQKLPGGAEKSQDGVICDDTSILIKLNQLEANSNKKMGAICDDTSVLIKLH
jgi:hypothetical protein